ELLERTLGHGFELGEPETDPVWVISGHGSGRGTAGTIFETIAPLLEHRAREFLSEHKKNRLIILEIPDRLLQTVGRDSFDAVLRLEPESVSRENAGTDGPDLVIGNSKSREELEKQAEYAVRHLSRLRKKKTREFVQQLQEAGIVRGAA
ncbi:MAG: hypothetical protein K9K79_11045, partial [Desulfohalobiaceae bacterium]|nr:hypothetical protein [Desulfohalobiaceae bacterium]